MSEHLCRNLRVYLETHPDESGAAIERRANLPPTTITRILQGIRPRIDRLAALVGAVDPHTGADLLRSYLLDDVPEQHLDCVTIQVEPLDGSPVAIQAPLATPEDRLRQAIARLRDTAERDDTLAQWIIRSADLMLGPP